jgi:PST family polysaccharide transporter
VALAALSRLNQDPARFKRYFANALGMIAFVGMAASAELTLVGRDVVPLVLGPQWSESGRIFELFGPGIGAMLLASTVGWIHLSIGKPGRWLRWTIVEFVVTASLFLLALRWGPNGVAAAWSVSYCILLIPAFWYAGRPIGFGVSLLIAAIWRYGAASLLAALATIALFRGTSIWASPVGPGAALKSAIIISSAFVAFYLGAVVLFHWGFAPVRQLANILRELAPRRTVGSPVTESV